MNISFALKGHAKLNMLVFMTFQSLQKVKIIITNLYIDFQDCLLKPTQ